MKKYFKKEFLRIKYFIICQMVTKQFTQLIIDKSLTETFDVNRSISYKFINCELVLVEDNMDAWFGSIFQNYHTSESKHFIKYITKLNEYQNNNELIENDFYYGIKIID